MYVYRYVYLYICMYVYVYLSIYMYVYVCVSQEYAMRIPYNFEDSINISTAIS